jgi:hypothetical protein
MQETDVVRRTRGLLPSGRREANLEAWRSAIKREEEGDGIGLASSNAGANCWMPRLQ